MRERVEDGPIHPVGPRKRRSAFALGLQLALAAVLLGARTPAQDNAKCLECHSTPGLALERDGHTLSLSVDPERFAKSVHGQLDCVACHIDLTGVEEYPHAKGLERVSCTECHDDDDGPVQAWRDSAHGKLAEAGDARAPLCQDCHGGHEMQRLREPGSVTSPFHVATMCNQCHVEGAPVARAFGLSEAELRARYRDRIHGDGLHAKGLTVTADCTSCHGGHAVLPSDDPRSSLHRENVSQTCGTCHGELEQVHSRVIASELWTRAGAVPLCVDCHAPHSDRHVSYATGLADADCLGCHTTPLSASGDGRSLQVDPAEHARSIHGRSGIACAQCHAGAAPAPAGQRSCATITERVECGTCHAGAVADHARSIHGQLFARGDRNAPSCTECHGTHGILEHRLPSDATSELAALVRSSPTYRRNVPDLCARCHRDGAVAAERYLGPETDIVGKYSVSIHGKALLESGLVVTAVCSDCHGTHGELPASDPDSSVHPGKIAGTCGQCHDGINETFRTSIHSREGNPDYVQTRGEPELPDCNDCHSSHGMGRTDADEFKLGVIEQCGGCHAGRPTSTSYTANGQTMPAQANNSNCTLCHETSGNPLAVFDAHLHPLKDPNFDTGLNFDLTALVESGTNDADGTIDPGEKIAVTFAITDDAGVEVAPAAISSPSVVISGPTSNYNLLLNTSIPIAALTGAQPFTVNVPMPVFLERLGVATGAVDTFASAFTPHWNVSGATTTVYERTATAGGDSTLTEATVAPQNYVDVASAAGFARDDYVVVDDGTGSEEYARIQLVDGTRLWFSSPYSPAYKPGLALAHAAAATVREVTLTTQVVAVDYTLTASTGEITEVAAFGDGNVVLASYTTDFVLPATYPLTFNDGPDLGEATGEWVGKTLVDGTYSLGLWSARSLTLNLFGESNSYRSTSDARLVDFLVGSAAVEEPYALISSGSNCFNCHQELGFHGFGRRGFESCVVCHGTSGGEDRPRYVAANAEETPGVAIGFRTMLHKIHMGEELTNAASYIVNGFGSTAYPNNFTGHAYGEIVFPALPGGVQNCSKCHGDTNEAWHEPAPRNHPTEQGAPVQRWAAVCSACHDSPDALAHVAVQTDAQGNESCGVCHGADKEWSVERLHRPY